MSTKQKPRGMTADELQRIVLRLANAYHCRYWLNWTYGCKVGVDRPWLMAVRCTDHRGRETSFDSSLLPLGFEREQEIHPEGMFYYVIPRLNEDGTPYTSPMG